MPQPPAADWPTMTVHTAAEADAGTPVAVGVPLPPGRVSDAGSLAVFAADGRRVLGGARPIFRWPDGSLRWALASFSAPAPGAYRLSPAGGKTAPAGGVAILREGAAITLDNGVLRLSLHPDGPGPISGLALRGEPFLRDAAALRFCVDEADTTREPGRTLAVLEEGPARVRVRVEGGHFDAQGRRLSYRLDVELWAGLPTLRLDYQFFNLEPGRDFLDLRRIAFECDLAVGDGAQRHFQQTLHGIFQQPREVLNPAPVAVVSDEERLVPHVEDPAMLLDEVDYPFYLEPPLVNTPEWLGVSDERRHAYLHLQDFALMKPKRLFSEGTRLGLEVWPAHAGPLSLQQGRSRRQVLTLTLAAGPRPEAGWVERTVAAPLWEGRATADPAWIAACGEFEQDRVLGFATHGRAEKFLGRVVTIETPAAMFDLGDTPDTGYTRAYTNLGRDKVPLLRNAPDLPRVVMPNGVTPGWGAHFNRERVWVNNEYDGIHAFACELMRTGKASLWPSLRWMARHNIEVDFLHYSDHKWLHRSSPAHSARHTSSGAYPSHFWTQGLLEYACVTGDIDAIEVAVALGDCILLHFHDAERGRFYRSFDRELGWALLALVHLYDLTREPRFQKEVDRLADFFMNFRPAGTTTPSVELGPGGKPTIGRRLVSQFYFMLNMVEALDLYERITARKDIARWLVDLLSPMPEAIFANFREGGTAFSTAAAMAIGYERTGRPEFLRAGMLTLEEMEADNPWWVSPPPEVKPLAVNYRAFIRFLGHAQRTGLLDAFEYPSLRSAFPKGPA